MINNMPKVTELISSAQTACSRAPIPDHVQLLSRSTALSLSQVPLSFLYSVLPNSTVKRQDLETSTNSKRAY